MPKRTHSRKRSTKRRLRKRSHFGKRSIPRSIAVKDTITTTGIVNAGQLVIPAGLTNVVGAAIWSMQLKDFPSYSDLATTFEFCRLNKCTIEYWPKSNMQSNTAFNAGAGNVQAQSISGTLITGIDQIPLITFNSVWPLWINDSSSDSGITFPTLYGNTTTSAALTPSYVRGLKNSRECELYKKQSQSFYPVFYTTLIDSVSNSTITPSTSCFERQIMKWVNCAVLAGSGGLVQRGNNNGPIYWGPLVALDIPNAGYEAATQTSYLFDIRMRYSMSFKRLRGN